MASLLKSTFFRACHRTSLGAAVFWRPQNQIRGTPRPAGHRIALALERRERRCPQEQEGARGPEILTILRPPQVGKVQLVAGVQDLPTAAQEPARWVDSRPQDERV